MPDKKNQWPSLLGKPGMGEGGSGQQQRRRTVEHHSFGIRLGRSLPLCFLQPR